MDSPTTSDITSTEEGVGGYASPEKNSSGAERSRRAMPPSFPASTKISKSPEPLQYPLAVDAFASPPTLVTIGDAQYYTGEIRAMADVVAQARKTGELPPTTSSPDDSEVVVHDHTALSKLRLARGDPALPPSEEYTRLRIETSHRIRDRDARPRDSEYREAATERVAAYLKVVGQEKRYYDLVREIAKRKGVESQGVDMERLMEEVMEAVEKGIGTTASELSWMACVFDTVARSLGGTARTLNTAATNFDTTASTLSSTASTLENTLGVMVTQISTLNSQILALTNALQSHHTGPASTTSSMTPGYQNYTQAAALEDYVRKGIENAICEALQGVPASTSHPSTGPSSQRSSYSGSTLWECDPLSDSSVLSDTGTKVKKRSQGASEDKTARRAGRYMRIVINKILG